MSQHLEFDDSFTYIKNGKLRSYLKKNINNPTVILCFIVLLNHTIKNGVGSLMTKSEIEKEFNSSIKQFGINTFRRDYIKRQSGDTRNAIDENGSQLFFLRADFLNEDSIEEQSYLINNIKNYYDEKNQAVSRFIKRIDDNIAKNSDENSVEFIFEILNEDDSESSQRRGQNFEICSFSILKEYFGSFGFELNRFSTTYANDGGMDYIGQKSVYQVTVVMSQKKFEEDIVKTPGIKRIIVYKNIASGFDFSKFDHELILRTINVEDLKGFVNNLLHLKKKGCVTHIISIMREEFIREFYLS
jgi:hypothetical protein